MFITRACIEHAAGSRFERVCRTGCCEQGLDAERRRKRCERAAERLVMEAELLHQNDGQRMFVLVFRTGDESLASLGEFASRAGISAAQISAIGALSEVEAKYSPGREEVRGDCCRRASRGRVAAWRRRALARRQTGAAPTRRGRPAQRCRDGGTFSLTECRLLKFVFGGP
jgi:hypothetical protein